MGLKLLLLLAVFGVMSCRHGRSMPGSPLIISRTDRRLQRVVLSAAASFNSQSNDAFLFKPSICRATRQVVKGFRYEVDLQMSRTVCRKRDNIKVNLSSCDLQPEGRLHQTFQCQLQVWVIPWKNQTRTLDFSCDTRDQKPGGFCRR